MSVVVSVGAGLRVFVGCCDWWSFELACGCFEGGSMLCVVRLYGLDVVNVCGFGIVGGKLRACKCSSSSFGFLATSTSDEHLFFVLIYITNWR